MPIGLSKYGTPAAFSSSRSDACSAKSSPDHSNTKLPSEEESSEGAFGISSTSSISQSLHRVIPRRNSALHDGQNISRWSLLHHGAPACFLQAFRNAVQRKPRRKHGELFILRPGSAKRSAQSRDSLKERRGFHSQCLPSALQEFSLLDGAHRKPCAGARVNNGSAEKFAVRRVNQRM